MDNEFTSNLASEVSRLRRRVAELEALAPVSTPDSLMLALCQLVLDALPHNLGVLAADGTVLMVNRAWCNFAAHNGDPGCTVTGVGQNYFEVCRRAAAAGVLHAQTTVEGLQAVLRGEREFLTLEYECSSPKEARWFTLQALRVPGEPPRLLVIHADTTAAHQAEDALRLSEQRYRTVFNLVSDFAYAFRVEPDGTAVREWASESLDAAISGQSDMHEMLGLLKYVVPEDEPTVRRVMADLAAGQEITSYEVRVNANPDDVRWLQGKVQMVWDEAHTRPVRVYGAGRDITDRKRAEEALRRSEARYSHLFNEMLDGCALHEIICDAGGHPIDYRFLEVNPAFERLTGLRAANLIGRTVLEVLPDTEQQWIQTYGRVALTGEPAQFEQHSRSLNRYFQVTAFSPRHRQFAVIFADVTERQQHVRELEALSALSAALRAATTRAEMLPSLVRHVSNLLKVDGTALAMVQPDTQAIKVLAACGQWAHWLDISLPASGITARAIAQRTVYRHDDAPTDASAVRIDLFGDAVCVACAPLFVAERGVGALWIGRRRGLPISDDDVQLLIAVSEITANALYRATVLETLEQRVVDRTLELAAVNARLTELDRLKSKFVSDVSHELRTPATSLSLYISLMESGKPEKRDHYFKALKEQAARLNTLIEDILDLSRLDAESVAVQLAPIDLNAIVMGVVENLRPGAEEAGLALSLDAAPHLPLVRGDRKQITQVVVNLAANAVKYTPVGQVRVRTQADAAWVCLEIQDTGQGIDAEDIPHVFERFYRGRRTVQGNVPGSGLGLAIVKEIVEAHGGEIEVDSVVGQGSTFRLRLPCADAPGN